MGNLSGSHVQNVRLKGKTYSVYSTQTCHATKRRSVISCRTATELGGEWCSLFKCVPKLNGGPNTHNKQCGKIAGPPGEWVAWFFFFGLNAQKHQK